MRTIILLLLCIFHFSVNDILVGQKSEPFLLNPQNIVRDILKQYKNVEDIPWSYYLELDQKSEKMLWAGLYQEANWNLLESGNEYAAKVVQDFLKAVMEGEQVVEIKPLGMGGATKPKAAYLPYGVVGVFKEKKNFHPSANYHSEIAAYEFDQLLGFRLVPLTVKRKINGKKGSLQYFVKNSKSVETLKDYRRSKELNVFDYLISNKDRNEGNVLIADGREIAIDHGLALRGVNLLGRYLKFTDRVANTLMISTHPIRQIVVHPKTNIDQFAAEPQILQALELTTLDDLSEALKPWIDESKIYRIFDKKFRLLKLLVEADLYTSVDSYH